jgi:hypothetical protein
MTQQSIDIMKDCELWCDFDTTFVDEQRGIVRDRSGHGRHPVAIGGPTFGANGPDSFEAVSLDGDDDHFFKGNAIEYSGSDFTMAVLADITNNSNQETVLEVGRVGFAIEVSVKNNLLGFMQNSNGDNSIAAGNPQSTSNLIVLRFFERKQNGTLEIHQQGQRTGVITGTGSRNAQKFDVNIGRIHFDSRHYSGDISFAGMWDRAISDTEIDYLNRLTAPRRSNV